MHALTGAKLLRQAGDIVAMREFSGLSMPMMYIDRLRQAHCTTLQHALGIPDRCRQHRHHAGARNPVAVHFYFGELSCRAHRKGVPPKERRLLSGQ